MPPADPIEAARAPLLAAQDQIKEEVAAAQAVINTASERLDRIEDGLRGLMTREEVEAAK